jgi:D-cysteine desulfhydrase
MPRRLDLAHVPTPLWRHDALDALVGAEVWVKRDDMSSGAEAGNKVRKLEFLLADALDRDARVVVTCGGAQSNHARATTLLARSLGLDAVLLLRTKDPASPPADQGNLLLDRMAGAEIRFITPADYVRRRELLAKAATALVQNGRKAYVIPEGGSNGLGALGYVEAAREIREQLDLGMAGSRKPFDAIVHACGSGGTTAGLVLGARRFDVAGAVHAMAVCDDRAYFEAVVGRIVAEAETLGATGTQADLVVHDAFKGPAYGVATREQLDLIVTVARETGLVLDPVYVGKAMFGLCRMEPKPRRVLFVHTGGLPGLLAMATEVGAALQGPVVSGA